MGLNNQKNSLPRWTKQNRESNLPVSLIVFSNIAHIFLESFMNNTLLNPGPRDTVQQTLVIHMGYIPEKSCERWNCSAWI